MIGGGLGFLRLAVDSSGLNELDVTSAFYDDYDLQLRQHLLYSGAGRVIDPNVPAILDSFGVSGPIAPDLELGRIFQVQNIAAPIELYSYAAGTHQGTGKINLNSALPYPAQLVRCGRNQLALRTDPGNQILFIETDLAFADLDDDGLSDEWETEFFDSTTSANGVPQMDFDNDGASNLQEFLGGTDPTNPLNSVRIRKGAVDLNTVILQFYGAVGQQYQLERSHAVSGPWSSVGSPVYGQILPITVRDEPTENAATQFYRLHQLP
jgi:hypothetical protein